MTNPAEPTTVNTPVVAEGHQDPATTGPEGPQSDPEPTPNSEAARYRVQLREAEAQRDALGERLTGYQRRECEAAVADLLDIPSDLWEVGQADINAFYNDDGTVNETELRAAADALIEQRPRLGKPKPPPNNWGQNSAVPVGQNKTGWSDVIQR